MLLTSFTMLLPKMDSSPKKAKTKNLKRALIEKFGRKDRSEDKVRKSLEAGLDQKMLLDSLNNINRLYERAKLDEETKFSSTSSRTIRA